MKRIYIILLSLGAIISAHADNENVIEIWTKNNLVSLRTIVNNGNGDFYVGKTVKLMADLDLGNDWTPIGIADDDHHSFRGTFDGQGYTITYRASNDAFTTYPVLGLFGYLHGTVQHLKVKGAVTNTNNETTSSTAGIAAYNKGTISECANLATIVGTTAGGIAGVNRGTITNCYNQGNIRATSGFTNYYLGGIAGANDNATISYTYASCTMDEVSTTGGITGNNINSGTVSNSYYNVLLDNGSNTSTMDGSTTLTGNVLKSNLDNSKWTFTAGQLPELTCFKNKIVRLSNTKNNNTILSNYKDQMCSVELNGRTLYKDGAWNTICLPFALSKAQVSTLLGSDGYLMELDVNDKYSDEDGLYPNKNGAYQTGFDYESGTLNLYFKNAEAIEAGKPYIIKWGSGTDLENPRFSNVTMANATDVPTPSEITSSDGKVRFIGNYNPVILTGGDQSNLYLGTGTEVNETYSTLYYPSNDKHIYSFRAYFHVDLSAPETANIRAFNLHFEDEEGLTEVKVVRDVHEVNGDSWYTLYGMKLEGKPSVSGVYIYKGRKVMIQ